MNIFSGHKKGKPSYTSQKFLLHRNFGRTFKAPPIGGAFYFKNEVILLSAIKFKHQVQIKNQQEKVEETGELYEIKYLPNAIPKTRSKQPYIQATIKSHTQFRIGN